MINAAGVIFLTTDKKALFLQRSSEGDCAGLWAWPGGKIEENETPEEAVERECIEELGQFPKGNLKLHARCTKGYVDYTTYLMVVGKEFTPVLNGEHTAFVWAPIGSPPEPMHPGAEVALQKFTLDELGIARFMTDGRLASPQWYENIALFDIRITGTGIAYRRKFDEFAFRDPNIYLNQDFLDRCNGLPVILEHPKTSTLNTEEFANRVVGTTFVPYIKGDEVWAIVKIFDIPTAKIMEKNQLSTSPAVVFRDPDVNLKMSMEDGSTLLVEGKPSLLDHIAICSLGVWDKGGDPTGINIENNGDTHMPTEKEIEKKEEVKDDAEERKRADAEAGQKLDKILAHLDSINSRVDALEKDEKTKADDASKIADAEEKEKADAEEKAKKDAEEKEAEMKAKMDAEEKSEREDSVRKDEEDTRKRIADLEHPF